MADLRAFGIRVLVLLVLLDSWLTSGLSGLGSWTRGRPSDLPGLILPRPGGYPSHITPSHTHVTPYLTHITPSHSLTHIIPSQTHVTPCLTHVTLSLCFHSSYSLTCTHITPQDPPPPPGMCELHLHPPRPPSVACLLDAHHSSRPPLPFPSRPPSVTCWSTRMVPRTSSSTACHCRHPFSQVRGC